MCYYRFAQWFHDTGSVSRSRPGALSIHVAYGFLADTSAPCVQEDVRYPDQRWNFASTNPTLPSISRSDRSQTAPAIQSDQEPLLATSSGVTSGASRMSAI